MDRITELASWNWVRGYITEMGTVYRTLDSIYEHINRIIPNSGILIGGSAAFFHHYQHHCEPPMVMKDVDVSLINDPKIIEELLEQCKAHGQLKVLRETCIVIPMGVVDLHIDTDHEKNNRLFKGGVSTKNPQVRFMNKEDLQKFYTSMNREKDQLKLLTMEMFD